MQISSLSASSGPSALFGTTGTRQDRPKDTGQFLPNPASPPRATAATTDNRVFSLPRHSLTSAAVTQSSASRTQLTAQQAVAAYQSAMNAQGLYGYQSILGFNSLMA
jgi:hypothetical protein